MSCGHQARWHTRDRLLMVQSQRVKPHAPKRPRLASDDQATRGMAGPQKPDGLTALRVFFFFFSIYLYTGAR